ncbi:hypothetical protein GBAR_LOCUS11064 [Geodia barretti]|uniref:Uncharacterized protein n=1 Tax=Geodia barretti TaxID=519541 RepID=A0AA35RXL5_GEOBA|nr:hypothetical protein GBAR_LOCUS11064 [Geodia barretti]
MCCRFPSSTGVTGKGTRKRRRPATRRHRR